jgi:glucose-1-phosphate thymidylyltransferase
MKIIVPMAGMGKRMRPHSLTLPKPLIPVAGRPIVQHLLEDLVAVCPEKVDEIAFVVGRFGRETEDRLAAIAASLGATSSIYYQDEALGTAHAILCAKPALSGQVIVAFADTLFRTDAPPGGDSDGTVWVKKIEDPRQFGVVKVDAKGVITDFVEKPKEFVSDLAIIGIYYFKDGDNLCDELQYLIDHDIRDKGEYQLTSAMENMRRKGRRLAAGKVLEWLDCGNKDATVATNRRVLELKYPGNKIAASAVNRHSVILAPCFIGENAVLEHSVVGPYASIGDGATVRGSVVSDSILQQGAVVESAVVANSMIGNNARLTGRPADLSLGDYSVSG